MTPATKPLLLLVEDDATEARRLESALGGMGYEIALACDGDEALALLQRRSFQVVLLDLVVPELDGMGVLGAMKARGLRVPVVAAVTAEGVDMAASAIRAGARDFVVKPAGALRLQVALANAVALGRADARETAEPETAREVLSVAPTPKVADAPAPTVFKYRPAGDVPAHMASSPYANAPQPAPLSAPQPTPFTDHGGHVRPLEEIEERAIRYACSLYGGRLTEVARRLGIGRSTLYRKLSRLGIPAEGAPCNLQRDHAGGLWEPTAAHIVAAE